MDTFYGFSRISSRPSTVREMANLLLEKRGTTPVLSVGEKWVYNFVQRSPQSCQVGSADCIVGGLGSFLSGGDAPLCGLGSGSRDTDRFGLAKGRTDNLKYYQLVRIKEIKE
jgi:hypothetical protein